MPEYKVTVVVDASDVSYAVGRFLYDPEGEPYSGLVSISAEPHMPQYTSKEK